MVSGGDPFYLQFWARMIPLERNHRFSVDIRSQRLSKNSINTIRSPLRTFQWA